MSRSDYDISHQTWNYDRPAPTLRWPRAVGLGPDGLTHDDPYCAAIAPMGTPEARHGELCGMCERRRKAEVYEEYVTDEALEHAGCDEDCHEDRADDERVGLR